ncbi:MAG: VWA domain-containing protein [Pirellulaceae bacterium]|nr:VWA domain-containing protein [Pirellulaceae bacterium]
MPSTRTSPPPLPPLLPQEGNPKAWFVGIAVLIGIFIALMLIMFVALIKPRDVGSASKGKIPLAIDLSSTSTEGIVAGTQSSSPSTSRDESQRTDPQDSKEAKEPEHSPSETDISSSNAAQNDKTSPKAITKEMVKEKPRLAITLDTYTPSPVVSQGRKRGSGSSAALSPLEGAGNPFTGDGNWKSTVFVIDRSGSMGSSNKFPRVVKALKLAIEAIKKDQSFTVILFDSSAYPFETPLKLLDATPGNKQAISLWLDQSSIGGGTNPLDAMLMAIELQPERILLLSDGEFDPLMVDAITSENERRRVRSRIDCVGLVEEVQTLQQLAKQNNGIYYQAQ